MIVAVLLCLSLTSSLQLPCRAALYPGMLTAIHGHSSLQGLIAGIAGGIAAGWQAGRSRALGPQ